MDGLVFQKKACEREREENVKEKKGLSKDVSQVKPTLDLIHWVLSRKITPLSCPSLRQGDQDQGLCLCIGKSSPWAVPGGDGGI